MGFHKSPHALSILVGAAPLLSLSVARRRPKNPCAGRWRARRRARWSSWERPRSDLPRRWRRSRAAISRSRFYEPGALVPPLEMFDSVARGAIEAAWAPSGFWAGKIKAAVLFSAVPFGPSTDEFMAWAYYGGGQALWREILAPHGIYSVFCQITPPEASGWFREEIRSVDDLKGLRMRIFGLGGRVMQKFGVSTQMMAPGDVYPALERGVIDATEVSMPAVDLDLGFYEIGQALLFSRLASAFDAGRPVDQPRSLARAVAHAPGADRGRLRRHHARQHRRGRGAPVQGAAGIAGQGRAAASLAAGDARCIRGSVAGGRRRGGRADPDFKRAWDSLQAFRADYKIWKDLGYLE